MDYFGDSGKMITAGILGVISIIISFAIFTPLQNATDNYYLEFIPHCDNGLDKFVRVYAAGANAGEVTGDAIQVVATTTTCTVAADAQTADTKYRSEHGVDIFTAANTPAAWSYATGWKVPADYLLAYGGITRLILSVLPVLVVALFLGVTAHSIYSFAQGTTGLQQTITRSIAGLLVTIAGLYLGPIVLDFIDGVYDITAPGRLSVMAMFGTIIRLVLGFFPVVYTAGLLGLFAAQGALRMSGTDTEKSYV